MTDEETSQLQRYVYMDWWMYISYVVKIYKFIIVAVFEWGEIVLFLQITWSTHLWNWNWGVYAN